MSRNIVFEGWLTKSPPTKRIWRAKWRRRWFALRQSGELPGQYFLDYFADRNCRRLKGTINLDLCEQVDAGLHIERGSDSLEPKLRGTVFTVRTQSRTYHLQADCEADMEKWVSTICQACGLRASDDEPSEVYRPAEPADGTGPYIAISECITGAREQESETAFTFDPNSIMRSTRLPYDRHRMRMQHDQKYASQSENDSNQSEDDSKSLASSEVGPPVPPRPPKLMRPIYQGPVVREPGPQIPEIRIEDATVSPRRASFYSEEEDDNACGPQSEYLNLTSLPPAVDRKLKPRRNNHHQYNSHSLTFPESEEKANKLHYIDLDLPKLSPNRVNSHHSTNSTEKANYIHGKESLDKADYRTVDFIKTEAFNITRMDAEAARSAHI